MTKASQILSLLIRILAIAAIIGIGLFIYQTCSGSPLVQRIERMPPESNIASYEVSTRTHIYYASKAVANTDNSVTMYGWWENLNSRWVLHEKEITLPKVLRPTIGRR